MNPRDYMRLSVFTYDDGGGNSLSVFPWDGGLSTSQMQAIARMTGCSETTFVTDVTSDTYAVRIFSPGAELPFAGHPSLGTAWALRFLDLIHPERVTQYGAVGETFVWFEGELVWLQRQGSIGPYMTDWRTLAAILHISLADIGCSAEPFGTGFGQLAPVFACVGLEPLLVPLATPALVSHLEPDPSIQTVAPDGALCFSPLGPRRARARYFAPGLGVDEDPATGSAALALGLYLARGGHTVDLEILQGAEIENLSRLLVRATAHYGQVGGSVAFQGWGAVPDDFWPLSPSGVNARSRALP